MDLLYKQSHHAPLPCGGIIKCDKYSACVAKYILYKLSIKYIILLLNTYIITLTVEKFK